MVMHITMRKLLLTIALLAVFVQPVVAEPLTEREQNKQTIIHGLSALDAITTIIGVGKGFVESNAILGVAPEPVTVITYFVARQVIHEVVTPYIDKEIRPIWQNTWIGVTALTVVNNLLLIAN
jgi:hypothetical protein